MCERLINLLELNWFFFSFVLFINWSTFTADESVYCMRTQKALQLFFKPEEDFWMIMVMFVSGRDILAFAFNWLSAFIFRLWTHHPSGKYVMVPSTRNIVAKMPMKLFIVKFLSNLISCIGCSMEHSMTIWSVMTAIRKFNTLSPIWPSFIQRYLMRSLIYMSIEI